MKTKLFAALLLALPILAEAQPSAAVDGPCLAKMGHHQPHHGRHEPMPPFLHGLKLSEAQQDKVFELMHEQAPLLRDKAKIARQAMDDLRQTAFAERYDEARAKALAQSAASAQTEMALLRARNDQKIYALLTAEQRKQLAAQIAGKPDFPL